MNALHKVVVLDGGQRESDRGLSAVLAELGLASVTTHLDAASEVLGVVERPSAIVLNMPAGFDQAERIRFRTSADRARDGAALGDIPLVEWDAAAAASPDDVSVWLRTGIGALSLSGPEA